MHNKFRFELMVLFSILGILVCLVNFDSIPLIVMLSIIWIFIVYWLNRIIISMLIHNRSFNELKKSKELLVNNDELFSNNVIFQKVSKRTILIANIQYKKEGILVKSFEIGSFGIAYKDIECIEVIKGAEFFGGQDNNEIINIITSHKLPEFYQMLFDVSDSYLDKLLTVYKGKVEYYSNEEYKARVRAGLYR